MNIHIIGDSHSLYGWKTCKNVISNHIGPILCYSFGNKKLKVCDINNFNIKNGDTIIFSFGEIDCRCHIHKYITDDITYEEIIDNLINNYIDAIKINIANCKVKLSNICIYNIIPTVRKFAQPKNSEFLFIGSDEERKSYVVYFNKILKEKCVENNYIFFDVYDKYKDENGFLKKNLSDNKVHILKGIHHQEVINKLL